MNHFRLPLSGKAFMDGMTLSAQRQRALDDGFCWVEAALISDGGNAFIYSDRHRTRSAAASVLRALLTLRYTNALRIIAWRSCGGRPEDIIAAASKPGDRRVAA